MKFGLTAASSTDSLTLAPIIRTGFFFASCLVVPEPITLAALWSAALWIPLVSRGRPIPGLSKRSNIFILVVFLGVLVRLVLLV